MYKRQAHSLPVLFVGGALLTSALELAAGWILKKVFHTSWWDYSDVPFLSLIHI